MLKLWALGSQSGVYHGVTVTVTDLAGRVVHENCPRTCPSPADGRHSARRQTRRPTARTLPAGPAGPAPRPVPGDLTELDGGRQLGTDLRDGIVTLHRSGDDDVPGVRSRRHGGSATAVPGRSRRLWAGGRSGSI
ncbi:hypothetical protein Pma05_67590 [Plantactinospora mayteni]|uniref:Uncharacterized protein n=1 Tax=Plantactinospora mayteni TaxID=566021 RepID=A0ABQ4EZV5_9ACTN|nr:hypothetical protein Pma05_67590 [Plantactinospora mayteni]